MSDSTKKAMLVPQDKLDKIIITTRSSVGKADSVGLIGFTIPFSPYQVLIKAIYSYDGGVTWFDCANYTTATSLNPPIAITVISNSDGSINLQINQTALVNGGNPVNISIRYAFLAPPGLNLVDTTNLFFTGINAYEDKNRYLEIVKEDSFQVNSASPTVTTIPLAPYGLGGVPFVEVFMNDPAFLQGICLMRSGFGLPGASADGIRVNSDNLIINTAVHGGSPILTIYYKIYKEV